MSDWAPEGALLGVLFPVLPAFVQGAGIRKLCQQIVPVGSARRKLKFAALARRGALKNALRRPDGKKNCVLEVPRVGNIIC